jgi:hypothetical protein
VLTPDSGRPEGAQTNATQSLQMMKRVVEKIFILSEGVLAAVEGPCPTFSELQLSRQFFAVESKVLRLRRVRLRSGRSVPHNSYPRPRSGPPFTTGGAGAEPLRLQLLFPKPNRHWNLLSPSSPQTSLSEPHRTASIPTKRELL